MYVICISINRFSFNIFFDNLQPVKGGYIIQLMHSFEVNIRICKPENSDVHRGKAEVNHFRGLTNPDINRKRMHQLFCYMTLSLFYYHIYKFTKSDVPRKIISTIYFPNFCNSY